MKFEEKIKKIKNVSSHSKLKRLPSDSAVTIAEFWDKVVEPLLPNYDTMKKWHDLLVKYVSIPNTVFMLRRCHDEAKAYIETVPADALRRGFLTKTDEGFWFVYNDNAFATYILAMALEEDIIDTIDANDLLTHLQTPNSTIRFHRSGKNGVEKARAYLRISGTAPQISSYGYTVAHIFDVNDHYYDDKLGFNNTRGDEILRYPHIQIDRGMYSDYTFQGTVAEKDIYYRNGYHIGKDACKFLEAHMLRYLHPLNYFCAPKDNMNGKVYCEFTDYVNNGTYTPRRFSRISGYEHLLYYAHHKFKEKYTDVYDDFLTRIMLPKNTFDFFENSYNLIDYYGSEVIDAVYANPLLGKSCPAPSPVVPIQSPSVPASVDKNQNKEIVFGLLNNIISHNLVDDSMLTNLTDSSFTSRTFGISTYPLLVKDSIFSTTGFSSKRFYGKSNIVLIDNESYRVCNQWTPERIIKLNKWHDSLFVGMNLIKKTLIPSDPALFKNMLLKTKKAERTIIYKDGSIKVETWNANKFTFDSNLMGNISSQLWHRKDRDQIDAAIYKIDNINNLSEYSETELYIECRKSWSSFRFLDRHCTGYCIENDIITVYYGLGFSSDKPVVKTISPNDMRELIAILDEAIANNALRSSNTTINTVHGPICTYEYSYRGQSAWDCGSLFDNSTIGESLSDRYNDLINKLTT